MGILNNNDTPQQEFLKVQNSIRYNNKCMAKIGKKFNLPYKSTTYFARHSFASIMKNQGASTELIKESLGHKDLRTTENYLASFDKDMLLMR